MLTGGVPQVKVITNSEVELEKKVISWMTHLGTQLDRYLKTQPPS